MEVIESVNNLLAPTIALVRSHTTPNFDFWRLINWILITCYWTSLLDLGQLTPTTYVPLPDIFNLPSPMVDFTQPESYLPTNNIFVNNTLFQIHSAYLREVILPLLNITVPEFLPLDENNRLTPSVTTFIRGYSCQKRQLKPGFFFSVFAVDFAFLSAAYSLVILIGGLLEKSRKKDGKTGLFNGNA